MEPAGQLGRFLFCSSKLPNGWEAADLVGRPLGRKPYGLPSAAGCAEWIRLRCLRVAGFQEAAEWARQGNRQVALRVAGNGRRCRVESAGGSAGEPTGCRVPKGCRVGSAGGTGRPPPCLTSCLFSPFLPHFRLVSSTK